MCLLSPLFFGIDSKFGTMFGEGRFSFLLITILSLEGMGHCFCERCSLLQVSVYASGSV